MNQFWVGENLFVLNPEEIPFKQKFWGVCSDVMGPLKAAIFEFFRQKSKIFNLLSRFDFKNPQFCDLKHNGLPEYPSLTKTEAPIFT